MNNRLIISLNWTLGTLFILLAVAYPVLDQKLLTGGKKIAAEQVVDRIAHVEERYFQMNENYLLFAPGDMPGAIQDEVGLDMSKVKDFLYDAYVEGDGTFVVRARAADSEVRSGSLPPLTYTYRKKVGLQASRSWTGISEKTPGLF